MINPDPRAANPAGVGPAKVPMPKVAGASPASPAGSNYPKLPMPSAPAPAPAPAPPLETVERVWIDAADGGVLFHFVVNGESPDILFNFDPEFTADMIARAAAALENLKKPTNK